MNIKFNVAGYRFFMSVSHYTKVSGVNSKLPNGKHFLMWDFDNADPKEVYTALFETQRLNRLPKIHVLNTGIPGYYHAYCFKAVTWGECLKILAETPGVDQTFFRIGVMRGYFTLRYSKKLNRDFNKAVVLESRYPETINPYEVCSFITYDTKRR